MIYFLLIILQANAALLIAGYDDLKQRLEEKKYFVAATLLVHSQIECPLCTLAENVLDQVQIEMEGAILVYKLDCSFVILKNESHCDLIKQLKIPEIRFFAPKINLVLPFHPLDDIRFAPTEHTYTGPLEAEPIKDFAAKLSVFFGRWIEETKDFSKFQTEWPLKVKAAYFDDFLTDNEFPIQLKFLSSFFHSDIEFAFVHSDINKQSKGNLMLSTKSNYSKIVPFRNRNLAEAKLIVVAFLQETGIIDDLQERYDNPLEDIQIKLAEMEDIKQNVEEWRVVYMGHDNSFANRTYQLMKSAFKDLFLYYRMSEEVKSQVIIFPFGSNSSISINPNLKTLIKQLVKYVNVSNVNNGIELKSHIKSTLDKGKFAVVWFYDTSDLLSQLVMGTFAGLQKYQKVAKIFFSPDPDEDRRLAWNITSLPKIYCFFELDNVTNAHNKWPFEYSFSKRNLARYFKTIEETKFAGLFIKQSIKEAKNHYEFEKFCVEEPCLIALLDKNKKGKLKIQLDLMNEVVDRFRGLHFHWLWADKSCLQNYKHDLLIYLPTNSKVAFLNKSLNEVTVREFIEDSLTGRLEWLEVDRLSLKCEKRKEDI